MVIVRRQPRSPTRAKPQLAHCTIKRKQFQADFLVKSLKRRVRGFMMNSSGDTKRETCHSKANSINYQARRRRGDRHQRLRSYRQLHHRRKLAIQKISTTHPTETSRKKNQRFRPLASGKKGQEFISEGAFQRSSHRIINSETICYSPPRHRRVDMDIVLEGSDLPLDKRTTRGRGPDARKVG